MGAVNLDINSKGFKMGQTLEEEREVQAAFSTMVGSATIAAHVPLLTVAGSELLPRDEPDCSHPPDVLERRGCVLGAGTAAHQPAPRYAR